MYSARLGAAIPLAAPFLLVAHSIGEGSGKQNRIDTGSTPDRQTSLLALRSGGFDSGADDHFKLKTLIATQQLTLHCKI